MKKFISTPAYSLKNFRLLPGYTDGSFGVEDVSLRTLLCGQKKDYIALELPLLSAAMQAVSGIEMATALAELGGVSVLPIERSVDDQCQKIKKVKQYKAGFQTDMMTVSPATGLRTLMDIIQDTSYSIFPVTDTGLFHGKLLGVITDKDFDPRYDLDLSVLDRMREDVHSGVELDDLKEANRLMIKHGRGFLPIVSKEGTLQSVVFKKDLDKHIQHPDATVDDQKRLRVGAAVSTYPEDKDRIRELVNCGVDFLVIDSSDGHTAYQRDMLGWIEGHVDVPVIGGNVITRDGFTMLAEAGAEAVKVGMGIGSGCITQEIKGTGRGQATAILEVARARDAYAEKNRYLPIIADGGITCPADIAVALALGADSVMMGNFFARFSESPSETLHMNGKAVKAYWMEGSLQALNHRRYYQDPETFFEEGVSGFVPHLGSVYDLLPVCRQQLKAALRVTGASSIEAFHKKAVLELQTPAAQFDSRVHNMFLKT
jgi:IMP dehydrogenase